MNKLWTFGDSFTAGHGCKETDEYYKKYYKEGDKLWAELLADEMGLTSTNIGFAPSNAIISATAIKENGVVITSSPTPISSAIIAIKRVSVPLLALIQ